MPDLIPLLEKLSQKLGIAVEVLWSALVKQARIERWSWLIFLVITISLIIGDSIVVNKLFKKKADWEASSEHKGYGYSWDDQGWECAYAIILGILSVIFLGIFMGNISNIIACWANPEYIALKKILDALQPASH